MKNLFKTLFLAFSMLFVLSCNKDDDKQPALTNKQKADLLVNFSWFITPPVTTAANNISTLQSQTCDNGAGEYLDFSPNKVIEGQIVGLNGYYTYRKYYTNDGCYYRNIGGQYTYNPENNTIILNNEMTDISTVSTKNIKGLMVDMPQEEELIITNSTLTYNGKKFYKTEKLDIR